MLSHEILLSFLTRLHGGTLQALSEMYSLQSPLGQLYVKRRSEWGGLCGVLPQWRGAGEVYSICEGVRSHRNTLRTYFV